MNQFIWLLVLPSGIYTNGYTSSTGPIVEPQGIYSQIPDSMKGMTLEECVKLEFAKGGHCVSLQRRY